MTRSKAHLNLGLMLNTHHARYEIDFIRVLFFTRKFHEDPHFPKCYRVGRITEKSFNRSPHITQNYNLQKMTIFSLSLSLTFTFSYYCCYHYCTICKAYLNTVLVGSGIITISLLYKQTKLLFVPLSRKYTSHLVQQSEFKGNILI